MAVQGYGRPHGRGRGAFAVTAVLVGSLVGPTALSGCAAPDDPKPTVDPALAVRNAADALAKAGTSKASTSMEMASGGTRVTIRGEGGYDFRRRTGRLQVLLPKDPAGASEHRPITELLTPGALYMKNRGAGVPADKWVRVDTTTLDDGNLVTGGATDPAAAAELLRGAREVTYLGEVELAGVKVGHYRGVADIAHAARVASPQLRGALAAAAKGFAKDTVPFDAYLDGEGRLRKVRHQFSFSNQGRTVAVASTTLLYGFGVPVEVTLPDRRDIYAGKIKA
ncbi:hypothetical protein [Streptomyces vietnamensis]|uniref:Lipoprotein n=1 Tax=Streptomyces vietnamensis TaxID=362257 RepID=A0A0B5I9M0_9ACTN|nr:hypothetical protein [Streptomyces vietnamensis]AJF66373.1 lipoprotein [Streptomyces vietnamensis]